MPLTAAQKALLAGGNWACLRYTDDGHNKFWRIRVVGCESGTWEVHRWWGRIGTEGQKKSEPFYGYPGAAAHAEGLLSKKLADGYKPDPDSAMKLHPKPKPKQPIWGAPGTPDAYGLAAEQAAKAMEEFNKQLKKIGDVYSEALGGKPQQQTAKPKPIIKVMPLKSAFEKAEQHLAEVKKLEQEKAARAAEHRKRNEERREAEEAERRRKLEEELASSVSMSRFRGLVKAD